MSVIYRFDIRGKSGATMQGYIGGAEYSKAQAIAWAIEDLRTGECEPFEIACDGEIIDRAMIEALAYESD